MLNSLSHEYKCTWSPLFPNLPPFTKLHRQARLRREYLYHKSVEDRERTILEKKIKLQDAMEG